MKSFYLTTTVCSMFLVVGWSSFGHTLPDWSEGEKSQSQRSERSMNDVNSQGGLFSAMQVDRNFNSSFSLNVPLFTVTIPGHGRNAPGVNKFSAINLGNIALLGVVVFGAIALFYPIVVTPFGRSFQVRMRAHPFLNTPFCFILWFVIPTWPLS